MFKKMTGLTPIEYRNKYNKMAIPYWDSRLMAIQRWPIDISYDTLKRGKGFQVRATYLPGIVLPVF
jgi:hypothetical protein